MDSKKNYVSEQSGTRTMQVQVTSLLLTDSVANAVSAHESSGMSELGTP